MLSLHLPSYRVQGCREIAPSHQEEDPWAYNHVPCFQQVGNPEIHVAQAFLVPKALVNHTLHLHTCCLVHANQIQMAVFMPMLKFGTAANRLVRAAINANEQKLDRNRKQLKGVRKESFTTKI